jgi:hypothetical protein
MVIDKRIGAANRETNPKPERLTFEEKISIAVTLARKCARAKERNDADDEQAQHSEEQNVSAFTMH